MEVWLESIINWAIFGIFFFIKSKHHMKFRISPPPPPPPQQCVLEWRLPLPVLIRGLHYLGNPATSTSSIKQSVWDENSSCDLARSPMANGKNMVLLKCISPLNLNWEHLWFIFYTLALCITVALMKVRADVSCIIWIFPSLPPRTNWLAMSLSCVLQWLDWFDIKPWDSSYHCKFLRNCPMSNSC